ncbi:phoenix [Boleophthalmus pectinirostris]|uniref:phoenix n=1 Tax=Boleophthalmus pectinirostris TaxID=150288 RepID=UPI00242E6989|nr:phoenix [Boleophthalmus pectinirostris]
MDSSIINEMGIGPVEGEESDSGDSVFLTQIPQNIIPNAARSPRLSQRSKPISPRFFEAGSSSSSEDEGGPRRRKRHPLLLKYNFPFLNQKKSQLPEDRSLSTARNRTLHYTGMAGFFSCVGEMWPSGQRRESFESILPTVDADNEQITPIMEDDQSGEEDVKIIDKRLFVYSIKPKITKSSQPWFKSLRNKIAETTKPTISQQHFGTEKMSQSASKMPEGLPKEVYTVLDSSSDSDETFIDESIKPRSPANDAHNDTVNLTQVNQVTDHSDVLCPLDESDIESQSILQNNPLDIRGRHFDNIYDVKELLSSKTKQGDKRLEDENETLNTSFSQESVDLFEDYITSYQSPHRHKANTPKKSNSNDLITENNGDTAEKLNDVESDLEASSLTELMPASYNQENQVKGQNVPKDAELLLCTNDNNHGDGTVQKKKDDMENAEKELYRTNLDPMQIESNLEKEVTEQSLLEDAVHKNKKCDVENDKEQNWTYSDSLQMVNNLEEVKGQSLPDVDNEKTEQSGTNLGNNQEQEKEVSGQSLPEDAERLSCPNVDLEDNGDGTVHKKKKHKKKKGDVENEEMEQNFTNLHPQQIVSNLEELKGQSLPEDAELLSCPIVDVQDNGDGAVRKKKKHKKKKGDVENEEIDQNLTNLHPQQIVSNLKEVKGQNLREDAELLSCPNVDLEDNGDGTVCKKKKHKKKKGDVANEETEQNVTNLESLQTGNSLEKEVPGQSLPEDTELLCCKIGDIQNKSDGTVRKKKKHKKKNGDVENNKEQNGTYLDPLQIENIGESHNNTIVDKTVSNMSDRKRKLKKKRKAARDCDDEFALKEFQLTTSSGLVESQEISMLVNNDDIDADRLAIQDDEPVSIRKKKKKKKHVSSAEKEQNGTYLDPMQIVNNGNLDDIIAVDKIVSDMSDNERRHKNKRKAVSDEDLPLKKSPLHNTDKKSSSDLVRYGKNSELVNNDNTDTDCLLIQGDESVKKKKKRKVHPMAERVENVTLSVSLSGEGHGSDGLDISTYYIESAENYTCLQETELGNKVKKKKKKNRNGELNNLDPNAKVMENPEMNECNKGSDCDNTEVNQPPNDEGDRLKKKKKKKKTSQSEHCQTGMGKTTAEGVNEGAILSTKESECPERKKRDKKRQLCDGESIVVETSEETELEQSTVKRKKHKRCFKDHEQTVSTPLHVEISPSSCKLEKNGQTKVKKRLHNPNETFFDIR